MKEIDWDFDWEEIDENVPIIFDEKSVIDTILNVKKCNDFYYSKVNREFKEVFNFIINDKVLLEQYKYRLKWK